MKIFKVLGISTIGHVANSSVELLEKVFGKVGRYLHRYANGEENSSVKHKDYVEPPKTIGSIETTPRDMKTIDDVRRVIYALSENVASRLREQNYKCRTVKVYIREYDLKYCDRQGKLETPSYITNNIAEKALEIFNTRYKFTKPLRSIGVRACDLVPANVSIQTSLFDDTSLDEKREKVAKTMDTLRTIYGYDIIQRGVVLEDRKLTYVPADYNRADYRVGSAFSQA
jgi:DNA polymerase-4